MATPRIPRTGADVARLSPSQRFKYNRALEAVRLMRERERQRQLYQPGSRIEITAVRNGRRGSYVWRESYAPPRMTMSEAAGIVSRDASTGRLLPAHQRTSPDYIKTRAGGALERVRGRYRPVRPRADVMPRAAVPVLWVDREAPEGYSLTPEFLATGRDYALVGKHSALLQKLMNGEEGAANAIRDMEGTRVRTVDGRRLLLLTDVSRLADIEPIVHDALVNLWAEYHRQQS